MNSGPPVQHHHTCEGQTAAAWYIRVPVCSYRPPGAQNSIPLAQEAAARQHQTCGGTRFSAGRHAWRRAEAVLLPEPVVPAPQPRRAADAAGASLTWARFTRKARPLHRRAGSFHQSSAGGSAIAGSRLLPLLGSLSTPASGAAYAYALGCFQYNTSSLFV
jgi:hypothetical protein